jgi:Subtilase family
MSLLRATVALLGAALLLGACASADTQTMATVEALVVVAVSDAAESAATPGSTPRARYATAQGYAGSTGAEATAAALAKELGLQEQASWRIAPLQWRCMLYRISPGADRAAVLARLHADGRVQLAQPLNQFNTLASAASGKAIGDTYRDTYSDPYVGLQRGFIAIHAAAAQRWSRGDGVRVALIDSGVDSQHPELAGRIVSERNFVGAEHPRAAGGESHGTEMAGVIAAVANNQQGIVGVAPQARLLAYRACWAVVSGGSQCNSFTLAQALGAAIAEGSDVINLSLGGPADPLLQRLIEYAMAQGVVVVGAAPAVGGERGFPAGVPGVLMVASSDDAVGAANPSYGLRAPGRDILTLAPGGGYGYASGSSLSAAHVSGAVAVLRALQPKLNAQTARAWLTQADSSAAAPPPAINLCLAVRRAQPNADCNGTP